MKKLFALLLAVLMVVSLVACGTEEPRPTYGPVGEPLVVTFEQNCDKTAQEIADELLKDPNLGFMGATMLVEEGLLNGFGNAEIKGFKEGVMFGPAMSSIAFVGYIFELPEDADVEAFKTTLKDSANLRWNVCVEAEELIVENEGNKVFFLMCPKGFEEESGDDGVGERMVSKASFTLLT